MASAPMYAVRSWNSGEGNKDYCPECAIMDKPLLTQDLHDAIIADNSKFKEYWTTSPEEVEEICRKFSEKFTENERCKYLKVERASLRKVLPIQETELFV